MSGEVMQFPKTVEEFMEKYKIVDSEQVYTNGAELVPIFRMKQWFEHIGAEPREIGHWLPYEFGDYHWHKCSVCGKADKYIETIGNGDLQAIRHFCPYCGAKMEAEEG